MRNAEMRDVLLYVTTHLSAHHVNYLRFCWPTMLAESFGPSADVHLFVTSNHAESDSATLAPFAHTAHTVPNAGWQEGAKAALYDQQSRRLFKRYRWVVRLNPDVIVYNSTRLRALMSDPTVDAILGNCGGRDVEGVLDSCERQCTHRRVMTDFMAFRGNLSLSLLPAANWSGMQAEEDATELLRPTIQAGRERWLTSNRNWDCQFHLHSEIDHDHIRGMARCFHRYTRTGSESEVCQERGVN